MNLNFGTIIYSNFTYPTDIQLDTPPDENLGMRDISQLQHSKTVEYHKVRKFLSKVYNNLACCSKIKLRKPLDMACATTSVFYPYGMQQRNYSKSLSDIPQ